MRLHRVVLRNFRGVTECSVALADTGVTIVEGDNETGKSSLAEGVDLLFAYLDSSQAGAVQQVKPVNADVGPEVEIEMSAGDYRFEYAKRWLRKPTTTLSIHAPRHEQLTGREAHDRVAQILGDHADMALWKALRLEQGVDLAQARLGKSPTLMRALELASGSAATGDEAADLMQRVDDEFGKYFTPTGQPNKSVKSAREAMTETQARVAALTAELANLDDDVERHARLSRQIEESGPRVAEQSELVEKCRQAHREISELGAVVERAEGAWKLSKLEATDARNAVVSRAEAAKLEREKGESCARLAAELVEGQAAIGEAANERAELRDAAKDARYALGLATSVAETASSDHEYQRQRMARDLMHTRHDAVVGALERRQKATAFLEGCKIDEPLLAEIEAAERSGITARAILAVNRTVVQIESLTDQELLIDGTSRTLDSGVTAEEPVAGALEIVVPERLRLHVSAGADTQEQAHDVETADGALKRLLRRADVSDVAAARSTLQKRDSMLQAHEEAKQVLATNLRDLTPEEMVAKLARLDSDIEAYEVSRSADTPLPSDLAAAEDAATGAAANVAAARATLDEAEAALTKAGSDHVEAEKSLAGQQVLLKQATDNRELLREQLAAARAETPDVVLDDTLAARESASRTAAEALAKARAAYDALDPETVTASRLNAEAALDRIVATSEADAAELQRVEGRLEAGGERGLYDLLAEAKSAEQRAAQDLAATERRSEAARLLRDVLGKHRDEARRRYRAPLTAKIEQYGRVVFGDDLSVELDADLHVVERTLRGVTVPYDSLSTGAREQLCVLERLASASLVSRSGGAPVVFDDALGYSDPDRLQRLGAVLAIAGKECQVLLLTCMPDRYSHVGGATVVRLHPGGAET